MQVLEVSSLVKCIYSAGIGRTGTFCTLDTILSLLECADVDLDSDLVQKVILHFRDQRNDMVETFVSKPSNL